MPSSRGMLCLEWTHYKGIISLSMTCCFRSVSTPMDRREFWPLVQSPSVGGLGSGGLRLVHDLSFCRHDKGVVLLCGSERNAKTSLILNSLKDLKLKNQTWVICVDDFVLVLVLCQVSLLCRWHKILLCMFPLWHHLSLLCSFCPPYLKSVCPLECVWWHLLCPVSFSPLHSLSKPSKQTTPTPRRKWRK